MVEKYLIPRHGAFKAQHKIFNPVLHRDVAPAVLDVKAELLKGTRLV